MRSIVPECWAAFLAWTAFWLYLLFISGGIYSFKDRVPVLCSRAGVWPHGGLAAASVFLRAEACGKAAAAQSLRPRGQVPACRRLGPWRASFVQCGNPVTTWLSLSPPDHIPSVALRAHCCRLKKKKVQLESCELSFIWDKMRTAARETASQAALRDCCKAAVGGSQCIRFWRRGSSIP